MLFCRSFRHYRSLIYRTLNNNRSSCTRKKCGVCAKNSIYTACDLSYTINQLIDWSDRFRRSPSGLSMCLSVFLYILEHPALSGVCEICVLCACRVLRCFHGRCLFWQCDTEMDNCPHLSRFELLCDCIIGSDRDTIDITTDTKCDLTSNCLR